MRCAERGYLDWRITILAGAIGGAAGDQIYFYAAHDRASTPDPKIQPLETLVPKGAEVCAQAWHVRGLVIKVRRWSARITIPLVCATVGMSPRKYSPLNSDQRLCLGISLGSN